MKINRMSHLLSAVIMALAFAGGVSAQDGRPDEGPPQEIQRPGANQPQDVRNNALRQLGLTREQIQQVRRLNMDRKPLMEEAQRRFRSATRALDEAIYADQINETEVQARLKDVQSAQAEVAKIRFMKEFAHRRILTPEQLSRFRELRQKFEQTRPNLDNRPPPSDDRRVNDPALNNKDNLQSPRGNPPPFRRVPGSNQRRP